MKLPLCDYIIIRNGKIFCKRGPYCWYYCCLNLKYLGWPYRAYIKTLQNGDFWDELLSEIDFEAVLVTFCCYDHGAKASEAVQKIATDQIEYRKCLLMCYNLLNSQNIPTCLATLSTNNREKWLVTRLLKLHRKKSNN